MTKEEFDKEYKRAEYRYAELKQYKRLYDNAEELLDKLYECGVRFDLPADSIRDKYIYYMRAKN